LADCPGIADMSHERDDADVDAERGRCNRDLRDPDRLLLVADAGGELAAFAMPADGNRHGTAPRALRRPAGTSLASSSVTLGAGAASASN
jgi:hypothetical protein